MPAKELAMNHVDWLLNGYVTEVSFLAIYQVWFHQGMAEKPEYELCTRVENVHLPKTGLFGVSAATGGLAGLFSIV